jgi:hypothetical protein
MGAPLFCAIRLGQVRRYHVPSKVTGRKYLAADA